MAHALTRVLIVEDDPIIASMTAMMVEDLGYWVVGPLATLNEALEQVESTEVDFALLDYDLGQGTTAAPLCERLRARNIPFVMTSGTNPQLIREALGKVRVLGKPVVESELQEVLP